MGDGVEDVLQLTEASEFLQKEDQDELRKVAGHTKNKQERLSEFIAAVRALRAKAHSATPERGSAGPSGASASGARRVQVPDASQIAQVDAKALAPGGAFVWKANSAGAWVGRMPPWGKHSRSWRKWTEVGALLQVLKLVWRDWADLHGLELRGALVDGLFSSEELGVGAGTGVTSRAKRQKTAGAACEASQTVGLVATAASSSSAPAPAPKQRRPRRS